VLDERGLLGMGGHCTEGVSQAVCGSGYYPLSVALGCPWEEKVSRGISRCCLLLSSQKIKSGLHPINVPLLTSRMSVPLHTHLQSSARGLETYNKLLQAKLKRLTVDA
jgi:hypothetical protein